MEIQIESRMEQLQEQWTPTARGAGGHHIGDPAERGDRSGGTTASGSSGGARREDQAACRGTWPELLSPLRRYFWAVTGSSDHMRGLPPGGVHQVQSGHQYPLPYQREVPRDLAVSHLFRDAGDVEEVGRLVLQGTAQVRYSAQCQCHAHTDTMPRRQHGRWVF